ncbi:hypothetical protein JCGZ_13770 [Jatropha curcas]|uniref:Uncharacterized protein n=1 Tax=Jatropha curcas TaxID=180498 RepID=A0A067K3Y5_JATCU|nr:uncharacterized protein LOC105640874 [Jatropha curcas]KDP30827.1 hypothetical protein JCGZ_13770 [Jatropha curcas]
MKNLYKKGKVHPSPPITDHSSLLPATILTLAAALSAEDREVLAYLISCSGTSSNSNFIGHRETTQNSSDGRDHDPVFDCNCFSCYMNYWARWDSSPNRQVIHDIIEAYEEGLFQKKKKSLKKKKNNKKEKGKRVYDELKEISSSNTEEKLMKESESVEKNSPAEAEGFDEELEKDSTVRKITSFIGEKIWGFFSRD